MVLSLNLPVDMYNIKSQQDQQTHQQQDHPHRVLQEAVLRKYFIQVITLLLDLLLVIGQLLRLQIHGTGIPFVDQGRCQGIFFGNELPGQYLPGYLDSRTAACRIQERSRQIAVFDSFYPPPRTGQSIYTDKPNPFGCSRVS